MTLIKSISGIRGTIGGLPYEGLSPLAIVKFTAAYAELIRRTGDPEANWIIVGRDARVSGKMVSSLVVATLTGMGFVVVDIGLATTPTTELAVRIERAAGGIILTASHNPKQWNAMKFLNNRGELLSAEQGLQLLEIAEGELFRFADINSLGKVILHDTYGRQHIEHILRLQAVDVAAIREAGFRVALDCINSVGALVLPILLYALGVKKIFKLNCVTNGHFAHNPEPLPEHLTGLSSLMKEKRADVGFATDPDVDRLAIVCENGAMFGEEYTLVAVADYILQQTPGAAVSNLSSSRALRDVAEKHGCEYYTAAVGEVNVTDKMKETGAVIGGEGNGGVIYPASHYGRDALAGIALFLSHLAKTKLRASELRNTYPSYFMSKQKIELTADINIDAIFKKIKKIYVYQKVTDIDGIKIDFPNHWMHLRKSNTEPIIRIYTEARTQGEADALGESMIRLIRRLSAL
ncbi:MAG: phosphoglucosamine mutase [Tannerella sp.]|jgi:phosphomannomutase|nr:phosphoglucosamine mutase [Tannerella sp.]